MLRSMSKSFIARLTGQTAAAALLAFSMAGIAQAETVTGTLGAGDVTGDNGGFEDRVEFNVTTSGMIFVDLQSDDFDTYLTLISPSGEIYENDDFGMDLNSRIVMNTEETGTFMIVVSSFDADGAGAYTLDYSTIELNEGGPAVRINPEGATVSGALVVGDGFNDHGSFFDTYSIEIADDTNIYLSVESDDFDTLLALITPSGREIVNDDFGDSLNSGVMMNTDEGGTYQLVVTSYGEGSTGAYTVNYQVSDTPFGGTPEVLTYNAGVIEGELTMEDGLMPGGKHVDLYEIMLAEGASMMIRLDSEDFDTFLTVTSPSGMETTNDDFGGSLNSGLMMNADEAGIYTIEVSSFGGGFGAYTLDYRTSDQPFGGNVITLDQSAGDVYGSLELGDEMHLSGALQDVYQIEAEEGQILSVRLMSDEFDTYLRMTTPNGYELENDDFAGELNSAIMTVAETAGTYTIVATSYGSGLSGAYTLSYQLTDEVQAGPATALDRNGTSVDAMLTIGDGINSEGRLYDTYEIALEAGEYFMVSERSDMFDSYLTVTSPSGVETVNDDFGGSFNSRILMEVQETGVYTITASTFGSGEAGGYTLGYSVSDEPFGGPPVALTDDAGSISADLSVNDNLSERGAFSDVYTFNASAGDFITIDMRSDDFDTFLTVIAPDGTETSNDDFEGSLAHSRVEQTAFVTGEYRVLATAYSEGEFGDYELEYSISEDNPREFFTGALEAGDATIESGQFQDTYSIEADVGQDLIIDLRSGEFDTYLTVIAPDGETLENDDYTGLGHSHVEQRVRVPGTYTVLVRSFGAGETGAYIVEYSQEVGPVLGGTPEPEGEVSVGQAISGSLEDGDALHELGEYRDVFSFSADAGDEIAFDLFSSEFDTYLIVISPDGSWTENDDFNGSLDHSHVEMQADESGEYMVIVTSFSEGESGSYTLIRQH